MNKSTNKKTKLQLQHKLKQNIINYRNIVTAGCGNSQCTNPYCKSNINNRDKIYSDADASKLAVKMVKNKAKICSAFGQMDIEQKTIKKNREKKLIDRSIFTCNQQYQSNHNANYAKCDAITRLLVSLEYYSALNIIENDNDAEIFREFMDDTYYELINDYI
eukprot:346879_1